MKFRTTLQLRGKTATGLVIPPEIIESFGRGKKPPVKVIFNGYAYRNTVAFMGGQYLVGVSAEHRAASGVAAGDELDVEVELDTAPREVEVPDDFAAALATNPAVAAAYDKLAFSHRKEWVRSITEAKKPETRERRIAKAIESLSG